LVAAPHPGAVITAAGCRAPGGRLRPRWDIRRDRARALRHLSPGWGMRTGRAPGCRSPQYRIDMSAVTSDRL